MTRSGGSPRELIWTGFKSSWMVSRELQPIQREFYLTMLTERKEKILDYSLDLLLREDSSRELPS